MCVPVSCGEKRKILGRCENRMAMMNALSCRSLFAKEPLIIGLFCEKCLVDACTGWRRCIECLKLQVSFRKRATNYRALLRNITYKKRRHRTHLRHPAAVYSEKKGEMYIGKYSHMYTNKRSTYTFVLRLIFFL